MSKAVLVTGANRGIGFEIVKQYAQSGCTVLACCRDLKTALELQHLQQKYNTIFIYKLDVSDDNQIKQLAEQLKDTTIDILFNNAGIAGKDNPLGRVTEADLISTFKVNAMGPVLLSQALINPVARSKSKMIVNISSGLGSIELNQENSWFWLSYRMSKSALNSATRCLANQLRSKDIIVVAIDPGWVKTDMGGKNADLTPEESVSGVRKTLENISLKESGNFLRYNGEYVPW